jgi:hypothetical protein
VRNWIKEWGIGHWKRWQGKGENKDKEVGGAEEAGEKRITN